MDPQRVTWRTSTRSGNSGNCVQVAAPWHDHAVALRDSKNPGGGTIVITGTAWTAFLHEVKTGQLGSAGSR
jgi:hypothetical protein